MSKLEWPFLILGSETSFQLWNLENEELVESVHSFRFLSCDCLILFRLRRLQTLLLTASIIMIDLCMYQKAVHSLHGT